MRTCNRILQAAAVLLVLLVGATQLQAQGRVANYKVENINMKFSSISGFGNTWYNYDPWRGSVGITLPFDFPFDNSTITAGTTVYMTSGGALALKGSYPSYGSNSGQGSSSYPALLSFMGGSLSTGDYHNYDITHYYATTGSSPNRVFIAEFRNVHFVCAANGSGSGPSNYATDVQVKLYETSGVIEFIYSQKGRNMGSNCFKAPSIGINGLSTPSFSSNTVATSVSSVPSSDIRFTPPPPPAQLSVQPKLLAFGNVTAGNPQTQCVTVRSAGPFPLTLGTPIMSGGVDYQLVSGPAAGTVLQPNATASYCVKFDPIAPGNRTAILTITSDGADSGVQSVNLTGVGIAPGIVMSVTDIFRKTKIAVGDSITTSVPIQSTGTGPLSITGFQITGANPDQYSIRKAPTAPIAVGQTDSIYITFKPTFEGRPDASIIVKNNSLNAPQITIRTFGIATAARLSITPSKVDFGPVLLGEKVCQTVTLANPGSDTVNITRFIRTSGDADFTYTLLSAGDTMILPEQSKTINVCFTPTRIGTRVSTMRIYSDLRRTIPGNIDTSQFTLQVTGYGVPVGRLTLGGIPDTAIVNVQSCITDSLRNIGSADISVTDVKLTGVHSSEYSISGLTTPFTLKAGQARLVTICLTPADRGNRDASLEITGLSQGEVKTSVLPLSGFGVSVCASADNTTVFDAAKTMVGMSDTAMVTITNCGDLASTFTATLGTGANAYRLVGNTVSANVPAGATTTFTVAYTPTMIGANSATLTVNGSVPGSQPVTVTLAGVGGGVVASATGGNVGEVTVNDCQDFTVTITNAGNVDWTPGTPQITGPNAADFTFVSLNPTTISANGTATMTLRYCPKAIGNGMASISFPNADPMPLSTFNYSISGAGVSGGGVANIVESRGIILGQNYPNPMTNTADFRVHVPHEMMVRVDIFDLSGAYIMNVVDQRISGEQTISIDAKMLPSGTYNYVMTAGNVRLSRQMVVVH